MVTASTSTVPWDTDIYPFKKYGRNKMPTCYWEQCPPEIKLRLGDGNGEPVPNKTWVDGEILYRVNRLYLTKDNIKTGKKAGDPFFVVEKTTALGEDKPELIAFRKTNEEMLAGKYESNRKKNEEVFAKLDKEQAELKKQQIQENIEGAKKGHEENVQMHKEHMARMQMLTDMLESLKVSTDMLRNTIETRLLEFAAMAETIEKTANKPIPEEAGGGWKNNL